MRTNLDSAVNCQEVLSAGVDGPKPIEKPPTILVVDDSITDRRFIGRIIEKESLFQVVYANDGMAALELMKEELPALVLTDLQMPELDGLELVAEIGQRFSSVPVILMTGNGSEEVAIEALKRGAVSYVPKRILWRALMPTVLQVLNAAKTDRSQQQLLDSMTHLECKFALENDPALVPPLVAYFQNHFTRLGIGDQTQRTRIGIALEEALLNGIYHGNLELSSDLRQDGTDAFERLGRERRLISPYRERRLHAHALFTTNQAIFIVRDEGPGFDVASLPDPTDPANMEKASGRGLLLIRTFMDEVVHRGNGNEITLVKRKASGV